MTVLTALGMMSLLLVIAFTWVAYHASDAGNGQTRREAIIEVYVGIVLGFTINWLMNWLLLPMVGASFTALENFSLGLIYTLVSVVRGYAVRRWANQHIKSFAFNLSRRFA